MRGGSPKQGLAGTQSLIQAIESVRSGGKLVGVSWFGARWSSTSTLRERSLRFLFPDISTLAHLEHTVRLVASGRVRLEPTITHVLTASKRSRGRLRSPRIKRSIRRSTPRRWCYVNRRIEGLARRDPEPRDLSPQQWQSGIAAWLGWLFDGLDMHLYVLVAAPFVAELIGVTDTRNEAVGWYSSWVQAAFLVGWALGGGFFGRVGDVIGRSRALCLTILTYALSPAWPILRKRGGNFSSYDSWRPSALAASGRSARRCCRKHGQALAALDRSRAPEWRQIGILLASCTTFLLAGQSPRVVFLVGVLPALLVFWVRREVPETDEWHGQAAGERRCSRHRRPIPRRDPPHDHPHDSGLLRELVRTLGLHILVSATFAKPAGRDQHVAVRKNELPASPTSW